MIKLLVVDHHPIIRKGLELLFVTSSTEQVVGSLDNGEAIFDFLRRESVDIILAEIDLPKLNGITALRRLKNEYPNVKVIMFSTHPVALPIRVQDMKLLSGLHPFYRLPKDHQLVLLQ